MLPAHCTLQGRLLRLPPQLQQLSLPLAVQLDLGWSRGRAPGQAGTGPLRCSVSVPLVPTELSSPEQVDGTSPLLPVFYY